MLVFLGFELDMFSFDTCVALALSQVKSRVTGVSSVKAKTSHLKPVNHRSRTAMDRPLGASTRLSRVVTYWKLRRVVGFGRDVAVRQCSSLRRIFRSEKQKAECEKKTKTPFKETFVGKVDSALVSTVGFGASFVFSSLWSSKKEVKIKISKSEKKKKHHSVLLMKKLPARKPLVPSGR